MAVNQYRPLRGIDTLNALAIANPVTGSICLDGPRFGKRNGHVGPRIDEAWCNDPAARDLDERLAKMKAATRPFEDLAREIGRQVQVAAVQVS